MSRKLTILVIIGSFLMSTAILPLGLSQITIYDSTFPLEQGKSVRWETVNATEAPYTDIPYVRFTVNKIYNDTWFGGPNSLIVNSTIEFYHNFGWIAEFEDSFYLAYNYSMNYLNWSIIATKYALPLIIPIPVNLILIGDAIERSGLLNYSYVGSTLKLDYRNTTTIELTYNPNGISTSIEKVTNQTTMYRWELVESDVVVVIPFTNYFLVITIFTLVAVICYKVRFNTYRVKKKQFD